MSWIDPNFPTSATPSDLVGRVLGLNPGMMTGPGTNTYLVGRRAPILIDTGAGVDGYVPLFERYLAERGWRQPERVVLTHRHRDHLGGVAHLRERFPGLPWPNALGRTRTPEAHGSRDGDASSRRAPRYRVTARATVGSSLLLPSEEVALLRRPILSGHDLIPEETAIGSVPRLAPPRPGLGASASFAHGPSSRTPRRDQEYSTTVLRERQILDAPQWRATIPGQVAISTPGPDYAPHDGGPSVHSP